jgi:hypothetical protein
VRSHGILLSITLPNIPFPRNALTRVKVSLQNVTQHTVSVWSPGDDYTLPQAEVMNRAGKVVYPDPLKYLPPLPGPPPALVPLSPRETRNVSVYVILRGSRVRAAVSVGNGPAWPGILVTTSFLVVRLRKPDSPHMTLVSDEPPAVLVQSPFGRHGSLKYVEWMDCYYPSEGGILVRDSGSRGWESGWHSADIVRTHVSSVRINPRCPSTVGGMPGVLVQWHVVAGWPGHSVAYFDYPSEMRNANTIGT